MFHNAYNFNQYIGDWNTGQVTSMRQMFQQVTFFNQDIELEHRTGEYGTHVLTSTFFNQDIDWNTSHDDMRYMFTAFLQPTYWDWDTKSENMEYMFHPQLRSTNLLEIGIITPSVFLILDMRQHFRQLFGAMQTMAHQTRHNSFLDNRSTMQFPNV